jgi:hypothetical protein
MLERALQSDPPVFCHISVEQPVDPGTSSAARLPGALVGDNFVLALGTLVQVCMSVAGRLANCLTDCLTDCLPQWVQRCGCERGGVARGCTG